MLQYSTCRRSLISTSLQIRPVSEDRGAAEHVPDMSGKIGPHTVEVCIERHSDMLNEGLERRVSESVCIIAVSLT